ncbi:PTS glucose transporter subunit IIA [Paraliobacillus zengyii]|uniref:PTS sugar transporter subunit IIA n=1 Tax=Paraliobacillus zengyii TaxID=2213194 RepID=UPI000E3E3190
MFGLFKNKNKVAAVDEFVMPIDGEIIDITEVEDPVFSEKMMGDGFAIIPVAGSVVSPVDGEIIKVFSTKHAIGIKSAKGHEILIHVGIDTVQLNGKGFTALVNDGDKIKVGQEILQFDVEIVKKSASSYVVPVVFTDSTKVSVKKFGKTAQGERDILSFG